VVYLTELFVEPIRDSTEDRRARSTTAADGAVDRAPGEGR
jgi:hypothetical protein